MSARRLGRLAGLVLALAVVFGGVGDAAGNPGESNNAIQVSTLVAEWD